MAVKQGAAPANCLRLEGKLGRATDSLGAKLHSFPKGFLLGHPPLGLREQAQRQSW